MGTAWLPLPVGEREYAEFVAPISARHQAPVIFSEHARPPSARTLLAALFAFLVLLAPAFALDFPQLTGRVVDQAGVLDAATASALTGKLADLESRTTDQFVVVTLKSLQGTSIEDFGYQLGRAWKIGAKDKNNGLLLIVAPTERKVRFEVGYGLEGTLTDAATKVIIETAIVPRFRANDTAGGISRGVDAAIGLLTGDAEASKQPVAGRPADQDDGWMFFVLLFAVGITFILIMRWVARHPGRPTGPHTGFTTGWTVGSSSGSNSSSWSSDSGGFSGGGGSFGGGGSSGSW